MARCAALVCSPEELTAKVQALEELIPPSGFGAWVHYLIEHAAGIILLLGGFFILGLLLWWLLAGGARGLRRLVPKSASLSPDGASITFEALAEQTNAMMEAMQAHVVQDAALREFRAFADGVRKLGGAAPGKDLADALRMLALPAAPPPPWVQSSFADRPPKPQLRPLSVLWVLPDPEARAFERQVVKAMGNRIELRTGTEAARDRLLSGVPYDLVVVEDAALGPKGQPAGIELALDLLRGMRTLSGVGVPRDVQVGSVMRLALLAADSDVEARQKAVDDTLDALGTRGREALAPHVLVTGDFYDLRRAVRWLQKEGTPAKPHP